MKKKYGIIIAIILVVLLGVGLFFILKDDEEKPNDGSKTVVSEDAKKFASEYSTVSEDNVFVYKSAEEIIKIMENGTGVVYLGFPECPWCQTYVKYLNEVAKEVEIEKIYYFNILEDRKNNTEEYKKIVELLKEELQYDDEGNHRIFVPNVSFHVEGKLIGNDCETSKDTKGYDNPADYWTDEEVKDLKKTLTLYMEEVYAAQNACTDCNK